MKTREIVGNLIDLSGEEMDHPKGFLEKKQDWTKIDYAIDLKFKHTLFHPQNVSLSHMIWNFFLSDIHFALLDRFFGIREESFKSYRKCPGFSKIDWLYLAA